MTTYSVTPGHPISGVTLSGGDFAFVSSGGSAVATVVQDGGALTVFSGGAATATVLSGGFEYVSSGGNVTGTVMTGGTEAVYAGGSASFSVVSANGSQDVYAGGTVVDAVLNGGLEAVYAGGTASGTVVNSGGGEYVYTGGTAVGTVLHDDGNQALYVGGEASGTVVSGGGTLTINPGAIANFTGVSRGGSIDFPNLVYSSGGSATVNGTGLLTVTEGASTGTLQLSGLYLGEAFTTAKENGAETGTVVTLTEPPRTLAWTGARDANFANAADWTDLTNGLSPALNPPNETDTAVFLTSGSPIDGSGTAAALDFGGSAAWQVTSGANLTAATNITVGLGGAGSVLINDGASIDGLGASDDISGASGKSASVTVDGAGSSWRSAGELIAGDAGAGGLTLSNGASLNATAAGSLPAMALGISAGGDGSLLVTGLGSTAVLLGQLNIGEAGDGMLAITNQGTVRTGDDAAVDPSAGFDIARLTGGSGRATVSGAKSLLTNVGRFVAGDSGLGSLSITAGATVTTAPDALIANTAAASGSSVEVSGAGSNWHVAGLLDVGVAGSGLLALSGGATVTAGSLDAGNVATAVGQIGLTGAGTELLVTGAATVADDGTGVLSVLSGATFSATSLTIGAQGDSSGALVVSGTGSTVQLSGALNIGTALGIGDLTVGPGAAVHASVVNLQGQVVLEGGLLDPTVQLINQGQTAGGFGTIAAGDIVDEGVIQAGGNKASQKLLLVVGTILGGGTLTVNGTQPGSNAVGLLQINAGGTLELTGPVINAATTAFTDNLTPTGTYTVNNSVVDVTFADAAGVLKLDDIAGFAGTITTHQAGDSFVITGGTLSNPNVVNGNTLTFADSGAGAGAGGIDQIIFASQISAAGFSIVNNNTVQIACFAAGTQIETATGLVAVEALSVGQHVLTNDGRREPIVWLGQRSVHCDRHPKPETVWPVRVPAGAFGENVPLRDLYLSPDHAVFVNGVLIPVKLLINGTSITQMKRDLVRYFHVELPRHAVILAEGLPVESYLDTCDRANFEDGTMIRLIPDFAARTAVAWETRGAAPLVLAGEKLAAARQHVKLVAEGPIAAEPPPASRSIRIAG